MGGGEGRGGGVPPRHGEWGVALPHAARGNVMSVWLWECNAMFVWLWESYWSCKFMSAPASASACTHASCPCAAAMCSAVQPLQSAWRAFTLRALKSALCKRHQCVCARLCNA